MNTNIPQPNEYSEGDFAPSLARDTAGEFSIDPINAPSREESIHQLNSFLRGEISATETYRQAIEKLSTSDAAAAGNLALLQEMQEEHGRAAQSIRQRIREMGGEPSDCSGAWGAWAKFTMGAAKLFGEAAALKALKEGEEHGLKDYTDGLSSLDMTSAELIQNQLLPAQQRHISLMNQLLAVATSG